VRERGARGRKQLVQAVTLQTLDPVALVPAIEQQHGRHRLRIEPLGRPQLLVHLRDRGKAEPSSPRRRLLAVGLRQDPRRRARGRGGVERWRQRRADLAIVLDEHQQLNSHVRESTPRALLRPSFEHAALDESHTLFRSCGPDPLRWNLRGQAVDPREYQVSVRPLGVIRSQAPLSSPSFVPAADRYRREGNARISAPRSAHGGSGAAPTRAQRSGEPDADRTAAWRRFEKQLLSSFSPNGRRWDRVRCWRHPFVAPLVERGAAAARSPTGVRAARRVPRLLRHHLPDEPVEGVDAAVWRGGPRAPGE